MRPGTPDGSPEVLITGGSSGIGLALAKRYVASGHTVIVTGRDGIALERATATIPGLVTFLSDMSRAESRAALAQHLRNSAPRLRALINNAGSQRRVSLAADTAPWPERQQEIDALLSGPIHLNSELIPLMLGHGMPGLIVNVTSGGAYVPQVFAPVYSACKAALHSYTVTLRHALKETPIRVVELVPPAVRTGLLSGTMTHGAPLDEFADAVFAQLLDGRTETIGFGPTATQEFMQLVHSAETLFNISSQRLPVATYAQTPPVSSD